jgi:hypothetical protein
MSDVPVPMFARSQGGPEKVELRGLAPAELANALDALALSEGQDRNSYVVSVLHVHVREQLRKASLLHRTLRGNPLLAESAGGTSE